MKFDVNLQTKRCAQSPPSQIASSSGAQIIRALQCDSLFAFNKAFNRISRSGLGRPFHDSPLSLPFAGQIHGIQRPTSARKAGQVSACTAGRQRGTGMRMASRKGRSRQFVNHKLRMVAGGVIERVRLLPDVERSGERVPGAARQHEDRLSPGARKGRKAETDRKKQSIRTIITTLHRPFSHSVCGHFTQLQNILQY